MTATEQVERAERAQRKEKMPGDVRRLLEEVRLELVLKGWSRLHV